MAEQNGNTSKAVENITAPMTISKPRTHFSTKYELGGSDYVFGDGGRTKDSDIRHLAAFTFDISFCPVFHNYFMENRWDQTVDLLQKSLNPRYFVAFSHIFFNLHANFEYKKIIESHFSRQDLIEIRNQGGSFQNYADLSIAAHF